MRKEFSGKAIDVKHQKKVVQDWQQLLLSFFPLGKDSLAEIQGPLVVVVELKIREAVSGDFYYEPSCYCHNLLINSPGLTMGLLTRGSRLMLDDHETSYSQALTSLESKSYFQVGAKLTFLQIYSAYQQQMVDNIYGHLHEAILDNMFALCVCAGNESLALTLHEVALAKKMNRRGGILGGTREQWLKIFNNSPHRESKVNEIVKKQIVTLKLQKLTKSELLLE